MIIKTITLNDAEAYLTLLHAAYKEAAQLGIHFAAATANLTTIYEHIAANSVYALQKRGKLLSTLSIRLPWGNNPGPYGLPHLGWFATDPDYKQQGLGNELMTWVEKHILKDILKTPAVTLGTAKNHPWLINMYQKQGYTPIAETDLGHGHITVYLQKILDETRYQYWRNTHAI